jgi:hypothetical protein
MRLIYRLPRKYPKSLPPLLKGHFEKFGINPSPHHLLPFQEGKRINN